MITIGWNIRLVCQSFLPDIKFLHRRNLEPGILRIIAIITSARAVYGAICSTSWLACRGNRSKFPRDFDGSSRVFFFFIVTAPGKPARVWSNTSALTNTRVYKSSRQGETPRKQWDGRMLTKKEEGGGGPRIAPSVSWSWVAYCKALQSI